MSYPEVKYDVVQMLGGLDQVTPILSLKSGVCKRAANFECSITGGYSRIAGYERFDGRPRPSDATYRSMTCNITGSIVVGNTVTGMTSGATGKVIAIDGSTVVITRVVGDFEAAEGLSVAAVQQATATDIEGVVGDGFLDATYKYLAAEDYRADIDEVPGSGQILGLGYYNDKVYAFRNNAGGTAADMYASSSSGWVQVTFGEIVSFSNANINVTDNDTLTQGGVTATIKRVCVQSGSLSSGTNTGVLILRSRTGGNFSAGAATSTGTGALTLGGAQTAITLLPNGRFNCVVANFGAGPSSKRMYCADGVNKGFEFDGTDLIPITTGMTTDKPNLVVAHKQHLFFTFGYSLQFSSIGEPYRFDPILGAGEIAMNSDITNLVILPGDQTSGALAVLTRYDMSILYGSGVDSFALASFNSGSGAVAYSAQNMDQTYFLNEQGITSIATTKDYGNFSPSALTMNLRPFLIAHMPLTTASGLNRKRGQYRVFFSDGFGLYATIRSGTYMGAMPVQFPDTVLCVTEGEDVNNELTSYFGSTGGYVFEMDVGTSFDGADIAANITTTFNHIGNHRMLKRYRKASVEASGNSYCEFSAGFNFGYRSIEIEQDVPSQYNVDNRSSYFDEMDWDNFIWDGQDIAPTEIGLTGTAENISFIAFTVSKIVTPFTLNSVTIHYTPRRGLR